MKTETAQHNPNQPPDRFIVSTTIPNLQPTHQAQTHGKQHSTNPPHNLPRIMDTSQLNNRINNQEEKSLFIVINSHFPWLLATWLHCSFPLPVPKFGSLSPSHDAGSFLGAFLHLTTTHRLHSGTLQLNNSRKRL